MLSCIGVLEEFDNDVGECDDLSDVDWLDFDAGDCFRSPACLH